MIRHTENDRSACVGTEEANKQTHYNAKLRCVGQTLLCENRRPLLPYNHGARPAVTLHLPATAGHPSTPPAVAARTPRTTKEREGNFCVRVPSDPLSTAYEHVAYL